MSFLRFVLVLTLVIAAHKVGAENECVQVISQAMGNFSQFFSTRVTAFVYDNVILSPVSYYLSLALLLLGTKGNTNKELRKALRIQDYCGDNDVNKVETALKEVMAFFTTDQIKLITKLYAKKTITLEPSYLTTIKKIFNADSETVSFEDEETIKVMGRFIKQHASDKAAEPIFPALLRDKSFVILTVIALKLKWDHTFVKNSTEKFHLKGDKTIDVKMFETSGTFPFFEHEEYGLKMIEFPLENETYMMHITLPPTKQIPGEALKQRPIKLVDTKFDVVKIPHFKFTKVRDCSDAYMQKKFDFHDVMDGKKSDLSGITSTKGVHLARILQVGYIEIQADNVDSAGVSWSHVMEKRSIATRGKNSEFVADRMFWFTISRVIEGKRLVILGGKVYNPLETR